MLNFFKKTFHNFNINLSKFQQATDKSDSIFDGIIETIFWVGPYLDMNLGSSQIPGLTMVHCNDHPFLQFIYESQYNKSVIFYYSLVYYINNFFAVNTLHLE